VAFAAVAFVEPASFVGTVVGAAAFVGVAFFFVPAFFFVAAFFFGEGFVAAGFPDAAPGAAVASSRGTIGSAPISGVERRLARSPDARAAPAASAP